jgi:hypothetical protein
MSITTTPTLATHFTTEAYRHGSDVAIMPNANNSGSIVPNGNSGSTGSSASGTPNYGGLPWKQITLPENGDKGYTAPDGSGGYFYFGPDQVLYHNQYSGEVHPNDVSPNAVGFVGAFFAGAPNMTQPAQPGADTPSSLATLSTALSNLTGGGAPSVGGSVPSTSDTIVPTTAGPSPVLPLLLLLMAAGVGYFWYTHHHGGGSG